MLLCGAPENLTEDAFDFVITFAPRIIFKLGGHMRRHRKTRSKRIKHVFKPRGGIRL